MNISLPTSMFLGVACTVMTSSVVHAQSAPLSPSFYAGQMSAGVSVGNMRSTHHGNQNGRSYDRGEDNSTTQAGNVPSYVAAMVGASMKTELTPGYNRQAAAYGQASADRWYVAGARQIGQEMRALIPEYQRRVQNQGRAGADAWYTGRAEISARRYASNAR